MRPSIGVVIATPGRSSILRTLNSIEMQGLQDNDDILVIGDGFHQPTADIVAMFGHPFRYVATEKTRDWGHSQANYGFKHIKADWVILQDDDDIFCPRAFEEMRTIIEKLESPRPIMGRVVTPFLGILWTAPATEPLDGHCILVPNNKDKLGYMGLEYAGDQVWIRTNLNAYEHCTWADRLWAYTRPKYKLWPRRNAMTVIPPYCGDRWTFHHDLNGIWDPDPAACLVMTRARDEDHWYASLVQKKALSRDELIEIVDFASQAGQGSDVWFQGHPADRNLIAALNAVGYSQHIATDHKIEYTFEWPPKRYEPPVKEEQNAST